MVGSVVLNDRIREAYLLGCENFGFCTCFVKIWKQLSIESHGHFFKRFNLGLGPGIILNGIFRIVKKVVIRGRDLRI
jgi:hypothetical protein